MLVRLLVRVVALLKALLSGHCLLNHQFCNCTLYCWVLHSCLLPLVDSTITTSESAQVASPGLLASSLSFVGARRLLRPARVQAIVSLAARNAITRALGAAGCPERAGSNSTSSSYNVYDCMQYCIDRIYRNYDCLRDIPMTPSRAHQSSPASMEERAVAVQRLCG